MQISKVATRVVRVTWDSLRLFNRTEGLSWGGAVGLYLFLSVPPLMVASALGSQVLFTENEAERFVLEQATKFVPAQEDLLAGVFEGDAGGTIVTAVVALGFLLFSGSRAFAALSGGVNVMWRQSHKVSFWRRQAMRAWMLGASLVLLVVASLGEFAIGLASDAGTDSDQIWLLDWQLLPSALLVIFLYIAYISLPEDDVSWGRALIGAVVATIGIRISQAVMGVMADAGTFQTPYGALAGVALLATWAFVVGVIALFGATIVAVLSGRLEEIEEHGSD